MSTPVAGNLTDAELIQRAIEQLKENRIGEEMLAGPEVRPAAVVYFKIRPHANCMLVLDRQTGERISYHFTSTALLPEYRQHCQLPKEAARLAQEIHEDELDRFSENAPAPAPPSHAELLLLLEQRCPGWTSADYERALTGALAESPARKAVNS